MLCVGTPTLDAPRPESPQSGGPDVPTETVGTSYDDRTSLSGGDSFAERTTTLLLRRGDMLLWLGGCSEVLVNFGEQRGLVDDWFVEAQLR